MSKSLNLEQSYLTLPNNLYSLIEPYNNQQSTIALLNEDLIEELQLNKAFFNSDQGRLFLSGTTNIEGPLYSQSYAGHQYGYYTTLGDGRAVMLGEYRIKDTIYDLQLKGSGRTPYSRSGDGKATLYSMLREYLISEAMHHLNIPTTRALAVLDTKEDIRRMTLEKGGILCRVASSHIRVGTFEFTMRSKDVDGLRKLTDYTIQRHYKELINKPNKYQLLLREVIKRQAVLISKWQSVGFVHGVMNTDNMTISGETIDYGPCAFLDTFIPSISFSSIDQQGRYAYNNQPFIGSWNLMKFAESIVSLLDEDITKAVEIANAELQKYEQYFKNSYYDIFAKKIGIINPTSEEKVLVDEFLLIMEKYKADFTNSFRLLTLDKFEELSFFNTKDFTIWFQKWTRQLGYRQMDYKKRIKLMEQHNPFIIPRNLIVEKALIEASKNNDYTLFNILLQKLKNPFSYDIHHEDQFIEADESDEEYVTFCGT